MFALSSENRFHLYSQPTDMRKSFDGLSGVVQNILGRNPCNGDVFIFINKRRDKIKLLHWQGAGFILYYKRLEKGTFELPRYDSSAGPESDILSIELWGLTKLRGAKIVKILCYYYFQPTNYSINCC
jgi:transposase